MSTVAAPVAATAPAVPRRGRRPLGQMAGRDTGKHGLALRVLREDRGKRLDVSAFSSSI